MLPVDGESSTMSTRICALMGVVSAIHSGAVVESSTPCSSQRCISALYGTTGDVDGSQASYNAEMKS